MLGAWLGHGPRPPAGQPAPAANGGVTDPTPLAL
jgi:hypothetical protein